MTVLMADSIESPPTTGHPIPALIRDSPAVAGYIAGNSWPTFHQYVAARPDLAAAGRVISITLTAGADADCLDIESGGATIAQAPDWWRRQKARGANRIWLYTFASNVQPLVDTMTAAGIARDEYKVWSAHFTLVPHICAPNVCGEPVADGTQYSDRGAENCDLSLIPEAMFGNATPTPPPTPPTEEGMIVAVVKQDGRIELFHEDAKTGRISHAYQTAPNGGWAGGEPGKRNAQWFDLGVPLS